MIVDKFGRRLIAVPHRHVKAQLVLADLTDALFWRTLAGYFPGEGTLAQRLGVVSDMNSQPFGPKVDAPPTLMAAEIFAHEYGLLSLGSSRHMEVGRFMWKGVGRNQLAVKNNWLHSWGGLMETEAMEEFLFSQKLAVTGGVVKVKAVYAYDPSLYPDQFFILRDMTLPRLASVSVKFNTAKSLAQTAEAYQQELKESGEVAWLRLLERQWKLLLAGWISPTPSIGNYDIAGRTLDMTGGRLFANTGLELFWYGMNENLERKMASPLDPLWWVIENALAPLHAALWSIEEQRLKNLARHFLSEHSALFALSFAERLKLADSKIKSGEWANIKGNWYGCGAPATDMTDIASLTKRKILEAAGAQDLARSVLGERVVEHECQLILGASA